nr:hypothetical protein Iba_chr10dCG3000 [Ipomoea batatas]
MASKNSMAVIFIMAFAICCYVGNSLSDAASNDHVTGAAIDDGGYKNPNSLIRSRLLLEVHEKCPCWPTCCWDKQQAGQHGHFSCTSNSKRDLIKDFGSLILCPSAPTAVSDSPLLTSLSLCKKTSTGREKSSDAARGASATGAKAADDDCLPQLQSTSAPVKNRHTIAKELDFAMGYNPFSGESPLLPEPTIPEACTVADQFSDGIKETILSCRGRPIGSNRQRNKLSMH